jgi:hypothetical protein
VRGVLLLWFWAYLLGLALFFAGVFLSTRYLVSALTEPDEEKALLHIAKHTLALFFALNGANYALTYAVAQENVGETGYAYAVLGVGIVAVALALVQKEKRGVRVQSRR